MISKKNDYDATGSFGEGFQGLPASGYVCRIMKAEEMQSKTGRDMVHIGFDIIEGDYKDYFRNLFQKRKEGSDDPLNVKYPFEGQMWIMVEDYEDPNKTSKKFKGFCTALEESGAIVWSDSGQFMVNNLQGASVGIVFQRQEQEYNGKTYWRSVPWACRSVQTIRGGDYFIPEDKPLTVSQVVESTQGFQALTADDCPF